MRGMTPRRPDDGAVLEVGAPVPPPSQPNGLGQSPSRRDGVFEAVLTDPGSRTIMVIKEVRALTNLGLAEAKNAVEGGPMSLGRGLTAEQGAKIQRDFAAVGARVE